MNDYTKEIQHQNYRLSKVKNSIFLGQQISCTDVYGTMSNKIPSSKRLEMAVCEELQMGVSIGLALNGFIPISFYQRFDFLLRAADQIVNHLDKMKNLTHGAWDKKVLIRTTIGTTTPLHPGVQHCQDYTEVFKRLVSFPIFKVTTPKEVFEAYDYFINNNETVMIVERAELYG